MGGVLGERMVVVVVVAVDVGWSCWDFGECLAVDFSFFFRGSLIFDGALILHCVDQGKDSGKDSGIIVSQLKYIT